MKEDKLDRVLSRAESLLARLETVLPAPVAERIVASENEEAYGRLAVLTNWRAETRILFDISPAAFVPQPKVTSSVVRLVPRAAPEPCDRRALEQVAAAAFGQRRKMLRQSLKSLSVDPARLAADYAALVPVCQRTGLRLGQRLHIQIFGYTPGT